MSYVKCRNDNWNSKFLRIRKFVQDFVKLQEIENE